MRDFVLEAFVTKAVKSTLDSCKKAVCFCNKCNFLMNLFTNQLSSKSNRKFLCRYLFTSPRLFLSFSLSLVFFLCLWILGNACAENLSIISLSFSLYAKRREHICIYVGIIYIQICILYIYIYIYIYMYISTHIYLYIYVCIYIYMCKYMNYIIMYAWSGQCISAVTQTLSEHSHIRSISHICIVDPSQFITNMHCGAKTVWLHTWRSRCDFVEHDVCIVHTNIHIHVNE